ncbi:MAG: beta-lactamase family protein, partial [Pseudomonadales bacterium]|nr:beta-lactamase family protein [Pseudomonadales bacterium]
MALLVCLISKLSPIKMAPVKILLVCLLLVSGVQHAVSADVVSAIETRMAAAGVPGLALVVIDKNDVVMSEAWGVRSLDTNEPLKPEDVFEAASNGKMLAAMAVLMLAEQGKLSLEDVVASDRLSSGCPPVTVKDLLSHTAGLGNDIGASQFTVDCNQRGHFAYAGEGYALLDEVIREASGQSSEAFIEQNILLPL